MDEKKGLAIGMLVLAIGFVVGCTSEAPAPAEQPAEQPQEAEPAVEDGASYAPEIDPANFSNVVDNPYFPLLPGTKWVYEGMTEDGLERVEIEVLSDTREVMGVPVVVFQDFVYLDGELIEETWDWFSQDSEGNVWYFGEETYELEDGERINASGAWEAGVDGAQPGIVMFADPAAHVGETYRLEYYQGEAEDMAELLSTSESLAIDLGSFENVVQTYDFTPLDPEAQEHKFYAEGIGVIQEVDLTTGDTVDLIEFTEPGK